MEETEKTQKLTPRQSFVEMLGRVYPDADFGDEDTLFGRIIDDYNAYADLINEVKALREDNAEALDKARAEGEVAGRNARIEELIAEAPGDGLPYLGGANAPATRPQASIFDLASY